MKAVVNKEKQAHVKQMVELLNEYPIIGIVDMESLPAKNLAKMRKQLRSKVLLLMRKKRLIKLAIKDTKKDGIEKLDPYLRGMPALLFTKDNPFSLFKTIKKNQSPAPIKAGQEAPIDLIVPAGPTEFTPGPMIGELGQMGIKTAVENGKIVIKSDTKIASAGDVVTEKQAGFLSKMGIEPMRIGLKLVAVLEQGDVIEGSVLDIDDVAFMADVQGAAASARNLAIELAYTTSDTIETLLAKAHGEAGSLAREADMLTSDNVGEVLAKASAAGDAIKALVPDAPKEEAPTQNDEEKLSETSEDTPAEKETPAETPETPTKETDDQPALPEEDTKEA